MISATCAACPEQIKCRYPLDPVITPQLSQQLLRTGTKRLKRRKQAAEPQAPCPQAPPASVQPGGKGGGEGRRWRWWECGGRWRFGGALT